MTRSSVTSSLLCLAAACWLSSMVMPITAHGTGSALSGRELADLVRSGALASTVPSWLGTAWYVTPLGGAVVLLLTPLGAPAWALVRLTVSAVAAGTAVWFMVRLTSADLGRFGPGAWVTVAGATSTLAAAVEAGLTRMTIDGRGDDVLR